MPFLFQYLIKFSISLAVLYIFYYLVLRPLTFYQWNRFYLVCYSLLSFVIPFINITEWLTVKDIDNSYLINSIPAVDKLTFHSFNTSSERNILSAVLSWNFAGLLFLAGAFIMLIRILYQYLSLRALKRKAVLLKTGDFEFYDVNGPITPFSFANAIFINSRLHSEEEFQKILEHEFVHVKQKHTIDIVVAELICVVNWFNPFGWLIRKSIRQNLEFIADKNVLDGGIDPRRYQYLLLKVMGLPQYSITNNFSFSSLKKRITMMNKMKTAKVHLVKFLFVLPLLTVMLLAFRDARQKYGKDAEIVDITTYSEMGSDTIPRAPVPPDAPAVITAENLLVAPLPPVSPVQAQSVKVPAAPPPPPAFKAKPVKAPVAPVSPVTAIKKITVIKNISYNKQGKTNTQRQAVTFKAPVTINVPVKRVITADTIIPKQSVKIINQSGSNQPIYIVDGIMLPKGKDIQHIDPTSIKEVNILKDAKAIALYGDKAKNGVVLVKTKEKYVADDSVSITASKIVLSNIKDIKSLIIVDGLETSKEKLSAIDPNFIKSISILKDKSATTLYGEKGKDGVIIVTTKKAL